jgi:uncharacterized membrane protein
MISSSAVRGSAETPEIQQSISMRKTIAKAVTWRLIGTAEIFAISFWMTGHIATAGHTAGIAAIASFLTYIVHELVWNGYFSRDRVTECGRTVARRVTGLLAQMTNPSLRNTGLSLS